jgi:RNA polymerase beta subunit
MNRIGEIRTTQSIEKKVADELNNSIKDIDGIKSQSSNFTIEKIFLGKFPIMVLSELCIFHGMTPKNRFSMGECSNDRGGYFVLTGKRRQVFHRKNLRIMYYI